MLRIINKDLTLMFSNNMQKIVMLIIVPMFLVIIEAQHMDWLYFLILVSTTYILIMTPFSFDITNKTTSMINSFPIKRKEIVIYRYLSVFVYILIAIVYAGVYLWIINKSGLINVDYFNISMIKRAIPYIMMIVSIMFPANFRFEPRLAQIINAFLYSGTIVFAFNLAQRSIGVSSDIIVKLLGSSNFIIIAIIVYILSMILSIRLYEHKDL
ncbi:MAG: ABC-2 transporter permease [Tissierellia bacterium]|nr:ABC-2 transporter permease [Tissierellia bacterium]